MTRGHDGDPGGRTPELNRLHVQEQIAQEVLASDGVIGKYPMHDPINETPGWDLSNSGERDLAEAFKRARTLLQGVSYQGHYWTIEYNLFNLTDAAVFEEQHPAMQASADRLLQLVVLSRVEVTRIDDYWSLPTSKNIISVKDEVQQELGVDQNAQHEDTFADFPGVDYESIVDALITGTLKMGNLNQPNPKCWQPS